MSNFDNGFESAQRDYELDCNDDYFCEKCANKDQQIAELRKQNEELKEQFEVERDDKDFYKNKTHDLEAMLNKPPYCGAHGGKCDYFNKAEELEQELSELRKQNEELENKFNSQLNRTKQWLINCDVEMDKVKNLQTELSDLKATGIFPKFKIGDEVWLIDSENKKIFNFVFHIHKYLVYPDGTIYYILRDIKGEYHENELFKTQAEAEVMLEERK